MTIINLWNDKNRYHIKAEGHANYDVHGKDILCASVSTLTQTFVFYAQNQEQDRKAVIEFFKVANGGLEIIVSGDLEGAYKMLECGLLCLAKQYPEHIAVYYGFGGGDKREDNIIK